MGGELIHLSDVPEFVPFKGYHGRLVHTELMTVAHWHIKAGHVLPEHSHPQEQIVNVLDGQFELTVEGEPILMRAGDVYIIPGNVPHSGRPITDCRIIDVWHPPRDDYRAAASARRS
jgi:quercetin dioxygenase-like cupin family protein